MSRVSEAWRNLRRNGPTPDAEDPTIHDYEWVVWIGLPILAAIAIWLF